MNISERFSLCCLPCDRLVPFYSLWLIAACLLTSVLDSDHSLPYRCPPWLSAWLMFTYVRRLPRSWNCLTILILSVPLYSSGFALYCDWNFSYLINQLQMDPSASSDSLQMHSTEVHSNNFFSNVFKLTPNRNYIIILNCSPISERSMPNFQYHKWLAQICCNICLLCFY